MKTHRHATSRIDQARRFAVVRLYDSSRSSVAQMLPHESKSRLIETPSMIQAIDATNSGAMSV